jgi:hypothetical protein
MYARGIHAREVRMNHKHPYTSGRDLKLRNMSFALRDKGSLSTAAVGRFSLYAESLGSRNLTLIRQKDIFLREV